MAQQKPTTARRRVEKKNPIVHIKMRKISSKEPVPDHTATSLLWFWVCKSTYSLFYNGASPGLLQSPWRTERLSSEYSSKGEKLLFFLPNERQKMKMTILEVLGTLMGVGR